MSTNHKYLSCRSYVYIQYLHIYVYIAKTTLTNKRLFINVTVYYQRVNRTQYIQYIHIYVYSYTYCLWLRPRLTGLQLYCIYCTWLYFIIKHSCTQHMLPVAQASSDQATVLYVYIYIQYYNRAQQQATRVAYSLAQL